MVEYLITAGLYLTLVMGIVEYSWIGATRIQLTNGCSKAARDGAVGKGLTQMRAEVREYSGINIPDAYIDIEYNSESTCDGTWMAVEDDPDTTDPVTGDPLYNAVPQGHPIRVSVDHWPYPMVTGNMFAWLPGFSSGSIPLTTSIIVLRRE